MGIIANSSIHASPNDRVHDFLSVTGKSLEILGAGPVMSSTVTVAKVTTGCVLSIAVPFVVEFPGTALNARAKFIA